MAKIEIVWMFLEMTPQRYMINTVFFPGWVSVRRIQVAFEGSELWALQVDGYISDFGSL